MSGARLLSSKGKECGFERVGRESHEPLVELVNGGSDIRFPEMRFVRVDASRLHETFTLIAAAFPNVAATVLGRLTDSGARRAAFLARPSRPKS